ncbi:MAG: Uma2 family endonuclease [Acidobacteriia bacterium]|nr:Uma2 family endonuclease [Terriglobia bacterium]
MSVAALISVEEYLRTSYSPDREYRDGVLVERNVGKKSHAELQTALGQYIRNRRKQWNIKVYTEMRIQAREGWYPIPDVCVYPLPEPEGEVPEKPPFLWIEILSPDDRMTEVWEKARNAIACGTPYVWIIDPYTLESELWTASGKMQVADRTLRLPDSPIVIPLADVLEE